MKEFGKILGTMGCLTLMGLGALVILVGLVSVADRGVRLGDCCILSLAAGMILAGAGGLYLLHRGPRQEEEWEEW